MVKFLYTILYAQDVVKIIHFYTTAFGFEQRFIAPDNSYGKIITGNTTLSFVTTSLAKTNLTDGFGESSLTQKPFAIEIDFTTDNIDSLIDSAVNAGATSIEKTKTKP